MTAKQRTLADSRRQRTAAAVEFQASDSAKFWLLNALNLSIPAISHIVDHATDHPEQAYLHLAQLIGQLCTFAVEGDPTTIPKFNYLELGDVFDPMFDRAHKLLDAVLAERFVEIPLTKREDGMFLGQITDSNLLRYSFFLAATGSVPEAQLRDRMPKLTKIASWSQIGAILNSAVNGLKMELEYTPPGALPLKPGVVFFKVVRTPEYWNDIAGTGTIAIYQPIDPQGVTLHLYAVDPTNLQ
jgi:type VI secretion system protein ImpJ